MKMRILLLVGAAGLLSMLVAVGCPGVKKQTKVLIRTGDYGTEELYLANVDGSGTRDVSNDPQDNFVGVITPDGKRIVFDSTPGNWQASSLVVMNLDGTGRTPLVTDPGMHTVSAVTPDGKAIVFETNVAGKNDVPDDPAGRHRVAESEQ